MLHSKRHIDWAARVAEYSVSDLPMREWCEQNNCTENQLKYWIKKARKLSEDLGQTWAQVEVSEIGPLAQCALSSSLIVIAIGRARVEVRSGFDPSILTEVLRVVASVC